jgi:hypothetical protein
MNGYIAELSSYMRVKERDKSSSQCMMKKRTMAELQTNLMRVRNDKNFISSIHGKIYYFI